jgi:NADH:ubiquinone reductase (H+-translocating)
MQKQSTKSKVLIVGGGFGGVRAAKLLSGNSLLQVTLLSDRDYFAYYPQLYHAATGGSRSEAALPLSEMFNGSSVMVVVDSMEAIDPTKHEITTTGKQTIAYDFCILALGNVTNYFGIAGLEEYSYNIKTIEGAEKFKHHLHQDLIDDSKLDANYVVVGAGPTGVELAAALGSYLDSISSKHMVSSLNLKIDLVEAAPRILPRSPETVSAKILQRLQKLGVTVMTSATVEGETATQLNLKGQALETQTVVWTAGVANNPFYKSNTDIFSLAKNSRVTVDEHLLSSEDVYVIGDNADTLYSGMAQTAINDANYVASDIERRLRGRTRPSYKPRKPISVIPVGKGWAAVEWGSIRIYGRAGWWLRRLADLIAYHDIESWPRAIRVWLREPERQDGCPVCEN